MLNQQQVENTDVFRCIECSLRMPLLKKPMTPDEAYRGDYADSNLFLNADGDECKCSLSRPPTNWCLVCSSCFSCTKYASEN